ncbi:MAG: hypothetical protein HQK50_04155 [Oligoflexia bacterium]|nr:hypothetical protein [Oligoflexia bacterium]
MKTPLISLLFFVIIIITTDAKAIIRFEDATFPELVTSGRPLAMGNAFICKADDASSVFYNPAGLGSVRLTHLHLNNFHLEANKNLIDLSSGGNVSYIGENISKGFSFEGTRQLLIVNRGKMTHVRANAAPNLTTRYISIGYLYSLQKRATIGIKEDALYEFSSRQDHGPFAGVTLALFGGILKLGASGAYVNRKELLAERERETPVEIEDGEYQKGAAWISMVGAKMTLPVALLPTVAVNSHNTFNSEFSQESDAGRPSKIRQSVDVGLSFTPQLGKFVRLHIEGNFKDANNRFPEVSGTRKAMAGMELDLGRFLFLRAGYGDGFGSGGIGLKSRKLEFDLSTYAVDTTSNEFRGEEDRRFSMTVSAGI